MKLRRVMMIVITFLLAGAPAIPAGASIEAGLEAYGRRDYAAALARWLPIAESGDMRAEFYVGELYLRGEGVAADAAAAAKWFERAARRGHGEAQLALAGLYAAGIGLKRDAGLAYFWMIQAAIGSDANIQSRAFASLATVGQTLDQNQKTAIGRRAQAAWGAPTRSRR